MTFRIATISVFLALSMAACSGAPGDSPPTVAATFVKALNADDVDALMALAGDSIVIREQEWETSADGYGFSLGATTDRTLETRTLLRDALSELAGRVDVDSVAPQPIDAMLQQLESGELSGIVEIWRPLTGYLFLRGMGDVEHIILIGVGSDQKVQAIYVN